MSIRIEFADNPDHPDVWRDIISTLFSFDLVIVVEYQTWTERPSWVLAVTSFCLAHVTSSGVTSQNPHTLYTITKDTPKSNSWRKQTCFANLICLCAEFYFYVFLVTFAESKYTLDLCKEKTTFQIKASGVRRSFQIWQLQLLHCQAVSAVRSVEDLIVSSEIFFVATFASLPHCHSVECGEFEGRIVRHKVLVLPQLGEKKYWIWDSVANLAAIGKEKAVICERDNK